MNSFEFNKLFAAILVAGITASFSGFIASKLVHIEEIEASGAEDAGSDAAAPAAPQNPEPILGLIASADTGKGATIFKACAACHSPAKGGPDGVGPHLWNIMNRGRAAADGYAYSDDMKAHAGKWHYEELNHFLWKPKSFVPGTKMTFVGLKKPEDRAAVIAYLRTLADSPAGLPTDAEIKKEAQDLAGDTAAASNGTAQTGGEGADKSAPAPAATATPKQDQVNPAAVNKQNEQGFKPGEKGPVAPKND